MRRAGALLVWRSLSQARRGSPGSRTTLRRDRSPQFNLIDFVRLAIDADALKPFLTKSLNRYQSVRGQPDRLVVEFRRVAVGIFRHHPEYPHSPIPQTGTL